MAVKRWADNGSAGAGEATTTDLSHLAANPFNGQSEAAGNTTTAKTPETGGAVGSPSEGTANVPGGEVVNIFAGNDYADDDKNRVS
jgi:hypothetical protein